jgi:hypothetical protein
MRRGVAHGIFLITESRTKGAPPWGREGCLAAAGSSSPVTASDRESILPRSFRYCAKIRGIYIYCERIQSERVRHRQL